MSLVFLTVAICKLNTKYTIIGIGNPLATEQFFFHFQLYCINKAAITSNISTDHIVDNTNSLFHPFIFLRKKKNEWYHNILKLFGKGTKSFFLLYGNSRTKNFIICIDYIIFFNGGKNHKNPRSTVSHSKIKMF